MSAGSDLVARWRLVQRAAMDKRLGEAELRLLLIMLDTLNSDTRIGWMSYGQLAKRAGVVRRSAIRAVNALADSSYVVIERGSGGSKTETSRYRMGTPDLLPVTPTSPVTQIAGTGDTRVTLTGDTGVTQSKVKHSASNPGSGASAPAPIGTGNSKCGKLNRRSGRISFAAFTTACQERGEDPIPRDDPIFPYAARVGIPDEFLELAWFEFEARYSSNDKQQAGVYGWRQTFRNAVKANWFKLWWINPDGVCALTTAGIQAQRAAPTKAAAA